MKDTDQLFVERVKAWAMVKAWLQVLTAAQRAVHKTPAESAAVYRRIHEFVTAMEKEYSELG